MNRLTCLFNPNTPRVVKDLHSGKEMILNSVNIPFLMAEKLEEPENLMMLIKNLMR